MGDQLVSSDVKQPALLQENKFGGEQSESYQAKVFIDAYGGVKLEGNFRISSSSEAEPNKRQSERGSEMLPSFKLGDMVDNDGFSRRADGKEDSALDKLKGVFTNKEPSVEDDLRKKLTDGMSDFQKKYYNDEERRMEEHRKAVSAWQRSTLVPPPPYPEAPNTPLHNEVERRLQAAEDKIAADTRGNLSAEQKRQIDTDSKAYYRGAGPATDLMKSYWEDIRKRAADYQPPAWT